jgi:hypothetical protein
VCALSLLATFAQPMLASAQPVCGDDVKAAIAKALAAESSNDTADPLDSQPSALEASLYEKYAYCAADAAFDPSADSSEQYCGKLHYRGSTLYERMPCCGYDPQALEFACPVEIRQRFGFGKAQFPGSREHVLTCVDLGAGFQPVARNSVHLADEMYGLRPNWMFAVITTAREQLGSVSLKSETFPARSILSWELKPDSCDYKPIWGNVIDYAIRLDP